MSERGSRRRLALLLPTLITPLAWVLLYLPSLDFPFVWEDRDAIGSGTLLRPEGETLAAFHEPLHRIEQRGVSARQIYYRPLPVVALSLVDQKLGREPRHFRALTIAAGALCAAAFGCFAGWLFGRAGPALFAALFAALHPVGIETTVWIAGIPATISAFFMIAALGCALAATRAAGSRAAAGWGAVSLASLALGLLSKEQAAVTPVLLFATLLSLGAGPRRRVAVSIVIAQLLLVGGYVFALRPAVLGSVLSGLPPIGGSEMTQICTAVASWPRQLAWIFAPVHSSTSDTVRVVASIASPGFALGAALALGSLAAWWALLRAGASVAALGLAWIWIAFAPTSGLLRAAARLRRALSLPPGDGSGAPAGRSRRALAPGRPSGLAPSRGSGAGAAGARGARGENPRAAPGLVFHAEALRDRSGPRPRLPGGLLRARLRGLSRRAASPKREIASPRCSRWTRASTAPPATSTGSRSPSSRASLASAARTTPASSISRRAGSASSRRSPARRPSGSARPRPATDSAAPRKRSRATSRWRTSSARARLRRLYRRDRPQSRGARPPRRGAPLAGAGTDLRRRRPGIARTAASARERTRPGAAVRRTGRPFGLTGSGASPRRRSAPRRGRRSRAA